MNSNGDVSRLNTTLARVRNAPNAGPGNTSGEPMSIAGHLVFASAPSRTPQRKCV